MRPNHLLAIIGAIMLVSAFVGAVVIEDEPAAANRGKKGKTFHVSFPVAAAMDSSTGNVQDGGSVETSVRSSENNITTATITITCRDNQPLLRPAATVTATVTDPNGNEVGTGSSTGGAGISLPLGNFAQVPEDFNMTAKSLDDVQDWVDETYQPFTNATGDWKVTISVQRGGFSGPLRQGSVDWTCEISYAFYVAEIKEASK